MWYSEQVFPLPLPAFSEKAPTSSVRKPGRGCSQRRATCKSNFDSLVPTTPHALQPRLYHDGYATHRNSIMSPLCSKLLVLNLLVLIMYPKDKMLKVCSNVVKREVIPVVHYTPSFYDDASTSHTSRFQSSLVFSSGLPLVFCTPAPPLSLRVEIVFLFSSFCFGALYVVENNRFSFISSG